MNDVMNNVYWTWSLVLLAVWTAVFTAYAPGRGKMLRMRLVTLPLGLTEPLFVPAYWTSPTIFDLARRTGVDLESLFFGFAVGAYLDVLCGAERCALALGNSRASLSASCRIDNAQSHLQPCDCAARYGSRLGCLLTRLMA